MKKKFLLAGLMLIFSLSLSAASGKCGTNLTWDLTNGVLTISGTGDMNNYYDSAFIPWYSDRTSIKTVIIENGVTTIGSYAFNDCSSLTSITIPNSVTNIGGYAFAFCSSLTSINIPNSVTSIGEGAFIYCSSLTSITIPNSVTSIGSSAFGGCWKLTSVTIPNSVTSIGDFAFQDCRSLPIIDNIRYADTYLVTAVDKTLSTYTIKEGTKWIGTKAFDGCSSLRSITIPNSVTSIGSGAFLYCSSLTSITIPKSVTTIGDSVFYNCSAMTAVHISDLAAWCKISFGIWFGNPLYNAHHLYLNGKEITELIIPENVTEISHYAFGGCTSLTSVTIPNSVTSIDYYAFEGCSGINNITIGNGITSISNGTFYGCAGLTAVTIPESVETIGAFPFVGCSNLTSVTWNAINCTTYDDGQYVYPPFQGCENITSFTIGENVQILPRGLCYGLPITSIIIPNKVSDIGISAFRDCSSLTSVTIPNSVTSIGISAFNGCSGLTSVTIGNGVTSIGGWAFSGCSELTDVIIPNKVTDLGESAFEDCTNLTTLTLGESITNYGDNVFNDCPKLTTIYNYRERPAKLGKGVFADVDYFNCTLYVVAGAVEMYKSADSDWKDFYFVEPIGAAPATTEKVEITPSDNTADFVWPTVNNAASYELVIKDKQGNDVCTLIFDAQGHLTKIAFAAPDRNRAPEQTAEQVAGFSFTITGLNSGTTYDYTLTAKDAAGNVLDTQTGAFTTDGATALDNTYGNQNAGIRKVFENGQLYILLPDNTRYNLQGMEVK